MKVKTTLHTYCFDIRNPEEKAAYAGLCEKLKGMGLSCFETWGGTGHYHPLTAIDGREIELETAHVFSNQWNTAPIDGFSEKGYRVFDWAQDYPINFSKSIKRGHYLDQTTEMDEVRRNRKKCGYCGHQETAQTGHVFCPKCIGSEYLKADELHLTRMQYVTDEGKRAPLTDAERAHLMPLYIAAQTKKVKAETEKARAEVIDKCEKAVKNAETERDGFLWLMDHGVNTHNVIYYSHNNTFSFGWRSPVSPEVESALLDVISEFPFPYEIKCQDGRKLEGY